MLAGASITSEARACRHEAARSGPFACMTEGTGDETVLQPGQAPGPAGNEPGFATAGARPPFLLDRHKLDRNNRLIARAPFERGRSLRMPDSALREERIEGIIDIGPISRSLQHPAGAPAGNQPQWEPSEPVRRNYQPAPAAISSPTGLDAVITPHSALALSDREGEALDPYRSALLDRRLRASNRNAWRASAKSTAKRERPPETTRRCPLHGKTARVLRQDRCGGAMPLKVLAGMERFLARQPGSSSRSNCSTGDREAIITAMQAFRLCARTGKFQGDGYFRQRAGSQRGLMRDVLAP